MMKLRELDLRFRLTFTRGHEDVLDVGQGRKNFLNIVLSSCIQTFSRETLALALALQKCSPDFNHL